MTIQTILHITVQKLIKNKITSPHLDAEILLRYVLKKTREYLFTHPEQKLTKLQISNYKLLINKRIKNEPVAYLTKQKQFYGLDFYVNKNVLIPRPETELMVDEALHITRSMKRITFIDVGTGSGCIIISIVKFFKSKIKNQKSENFFATDISKSALAVARKNAKFHNIHNQIKFLQGNLLKPLLNKSVIDNRQSTITITANLPYLTPTQIKNSPSIQHEPKLALTAGPDGLKYYRKLFKQINVMRSMFHVPYFVLCEIDPSQTSKIKQLIKNNLPLSQIKIKKDLAGLNRLVIIKVY